MAKRPKRRTQEWRMEGWASRERAIRERMEIAWKEAMDKKILGDDWIRLGLSEDETPSPTEATPAGPPTQRRLRIKKQ